MGKKAKEHRKKVAARNANLKRTENSLMNLLKKIQTEKITETPKEENKD